MLALVLLKQHKINKELNWFAEHNTWLLTSKIEHEKLIYKIFHIHISFHICMENRIINYGIYLNPALYTTHGQCWVFVTLCQRAVLLCCPEPSFSGQYNVCQFLWSYELQWHTFVQQMEHTIKVLNFSILKTSVLNLLSINLPLSMDSG